MRMILLLITVFGITGASLALAVTLCPDGNYYPGQSCQLMPNGKYAGRGFDAPVTLRMPRGPNGGEALGQGVASLILGLANLFRGQQQVDTPFEMQPSRPDQGSEKQYATQNLVYKRQLERSRANVRKAGETTGWREADSYRNDQLIQAYEDACHLKRFLAKAVTGKAMKCAHDFKRSGGSFQGRLYGEAIQAVKNISGIPPDVELEIQTEFRAGYIEGFIQGTQPAVENLREFFIVGCLAGLLEIFNDIGN